MKYIGYAASVGETDIFNTIDFAYENDFSAVEINMNVPVYFPENFNHCEREKIRKYKENKKVEITLHAPEDISLLQLHEDVRKAGIDRFKQVIQFGIDIGASRITMHVGSAVCFTLVDRKSYMDEFYYDEYKKILRHSLKDLVDYCGDKIKLCVENSGRFPEKLVQETVQELLDEDNLYLTWDIGHSYENKYNEEKFFTRNVNKIRTCHLHDNNGKSDHQIIGTGSVDFDKHLNLMKNKDIVFIIEVRPRENAVTSLKKLKLLI